MVTKKPLVSIVIPSFNAGSYIRECLESIFFQTYKNIEIIIIDDCSTDNTQKIVKTFQKKDKRIRYFKNSTNQGVAEAFNFGVLQAKSKLIARMDADDIMFPDRIEKQTQYLLEQPDTVVVGGQCVVINKQGEITGSKNFPLTDKQIKDQLFQTVPMQQPTIMINTALIPTVDNLTRKRFSPAEDYDLFFRLSQYGKFANLKSNTLYYREHDTNISLKNPKYTFWRIWDARITGIKESKYRPSLKSWIIVTLQTLAVVLLPNSLIYPLHKLTKGMHKTKI